MRIGLDIDDVILDTDKALLEEFLIEDKNKRNKGIINENADYIMSGMFDWSKEEIKEFLANNMERIAENVKPLEGAKEYIDKLLEDGHEIYLITNRAFPNYKNPRETTEESLRKNNINYTKLIITETNDKTKECLDYKIDIMFDDRASNCFKLLEKNINCCLMRSRFERRNFENLQIVNNWKELYNKVCELNNK